ncbi:hypothetical protein QAD02_022014 [Eretmocerus hayati]|uniref:Uncharacterized protein n=1 Tax=Eretmocerus hayati TaxID=131215 RepID=A0ACC2PWP1_9HYME|nr:hypothetical protein QAD02_022014 [Eretmocerus hayati]
MRQSGRTETTRGDGPPRHGRRARKDDSTGVQPTQGPPQLRPHLRARGDDSRDKASSQEEEAARQAEVGARAGEPGLRRRSYANFAGAHECRSRMAAHSPTALDDLEIEQGPASETGLERPLVVGLGIVGSDQSALATLAAAADGYTDWPWRLGTRQ